MWHTLSSTVSTSILLYELRKHIIREITVINSNRRIQRILIDVSNYIVLTTFVHGYLFLRLSESPFCNSIILCIYWYNRAVNHYPSMSKKIWHRPLVLHSAHIHTHTHIHTTSLLSNINNENSLNFSTHSMFFSFMNAGRK